MTRQLLLRWLIASIARGLAWFIAIKLGATALDADSFAHAAAQAAGALGIAGLALYDSIHSRHALVKQATSLQSNLPPQTQTTNAPGASK